MNAIDVIKTELACVQRDCCRVENQCAKCDLVLPVEEIISAYKKCISLLELEAQIEKMRNCGNCNGIVEGGIRTENCKFCIDSKYLSRWELRND